MHVEMDAQLQSDMAEITGASLSKPHTNMNALHMRVYTYACWFVCLDRPLSINFK